MLERRLTEKEDMNEEINGKRTKHKRSMKARNECKKKEKKLEAQRERNKAMMEEEDRKIEEMRIRKNNRKWDYLKWPVDREQKKEHELYIENKISTNENEQKKYIKEYWGKIGKKKSNDKEKKYRILMQKMNITKEQNYRITKQDVKNQIFQQGTET